MAVIALLATLYALDVHAAVVSLYIPSNVFDEGVPLTADPIGVDASGQTTWVLAIGSPSGTFTATLPSVTGLNVTLVEGPTDAHVAATQSDTVLREDCAIASPTASGALPIASCSLGVIINSNSYSLAGTEIASPIPVQVAAARNGAENMRMAMGGVALSALVVVGAMGVLFTQM
ncbi:hypothetical protein BD311DRAFT_657332 [Dichomitus squalens]|uniref:Uncharacterized protein n=1 Tax=Dichomitus squalens TaxID=114155 RepID=A0A4V2K131_9APHY|nr:hypothetical protein BD311DRAFT_657332 [Dichomitus squalens]